MIARMRLYLASGNRHKQREMQQLLASFEIRIPDDDSIMFKPEETGATFAENSLIKARALWNFVHEPVIADDSGLCVTSLGGAPGIYTSRYAGPAYMHGRPDGVKLTQEEQNRLLIGQVNALGTSDRSCHYVCAMVLLLAPDRYFLAQETFEGELVTSMKDAAGTGGFGYDPIVYLPQYGRTVAEISATEKNAISHRGKAVRALAAILRELTS